MTAAAKDNPAPQEKGKDISRWLLPAASSDNHPDNFSSTALVAASSDTHSLALPYLSNEQQVSSDASSSDRLLVPVAVHPSLPPPSTPIPPQSLIMDRTPQTLLDNRPFNNNNSNENDDFWANTFLEPSAAAAVAASSAASPPRRLDPDMDFLQHLQEPLMVMSPASADSSSGHRMPAGAFPSWFWAWYRNTWCGLPPVASRNDTNTGSTQSNDASDGPISTTQCVPTVLLLAVWTLLVWLLGTRSSPCPALSPPEPQWFPAVQRHQYLLDCAARMAHDATNHGSLYNSSFSNYSLAQSAAMDWFLTGPGRDIPIDSCHDDTDGSSKSSNTNGGGDNPNNAPCQHDNDFQPLFALVVLRGALRVPFATWNRDAVPIRSLGDVCHWARVTCSEKPIEEFEHTLNGKQAVFPSQHVVTRLTLEHANLTGTLPREMVVGLPHLTSLELFSNAFLLGTLPEFVGQWIDMQALKLHSTSLSGTIPNSWSRLTSLQELRLDGTRIVGSVPEELCQLSQLQHISVPDTVSCSCCKR